MVTTRTRPPTAAASPSTASSHFPYPPMHVLAALVELENEAADQDHALGAIARRVNMDPTTVCRMLGVARGLRLVRQIERGRYSSAFSRSAPATAPVIEPDLDGHEVLDRLHASTDAPALLYVPALLADVSTRILVSGVYGHHQDHVLSSPRSHQLALRQGPLDADPAGQVILAHLLPEGDLAPALRPVRYGAVAAGPSPISGLAMIAAPVWRGPTVAGSLVVLPATDVLRNTAKRRRLSHQVASAAQAYSHAAQAYSHRTTVELMNCDELRDAS